MLLQHSHPLYRHASINRLAHVIYREQADLHRCECFHFYAGLAGGFTLHPAGDAVCCFVRHKTDIHPAEAKWMAKWNEVTGFFAGLNGGNPGDAEHVAFFGSALQDGLQGIGLHHDMALGDGDAFGMCFVTNIDHMSMALVVKVGQS